MLHYPALWLPNINSSVINPQPTTFPLHDLNLRFQNRSHAGMLQVLFNAFLLRFEQHGIRPVPKFDTLFPTGTFENQETFFQNAGLQNLWRPCSNCLSAPKSGSLNKNWHL